MNYVITKITPDNEIKGTFTNFFLVEFWSQNKFCRSFTYSPKQNCGRTN